MILSRYHTQPGAVNMSGHLFGPATVAALQASMVNIYMQLDSPSAQSGQEY